MIGETLKWRREGYDFHGRHFMAYIAIEGACEIHVNRWGEQPWMYTLFRNGHYYTDRGGYHLARQARAAAEAKFYELGLNIPF